MEEVRIGLLGLGTVGAAVARTLVDRADTLAERSGRNLVVRRVAVRDAAKARALDLGDVAPTTDAGRVVRDPEVDIVVELIGGMEPARTLVLEALSHGKPVVTANKELLANAGREVMDAAEAAGVDLLFEAAVGGGIPIVRPMKESLAGDRVRRVMGIVNGTTNYILTRMTETGCSFAAALDEAQRLGYSELDPSADIHGSDAASKLAILASLAFNTRVTANDVQREGIARVTVADIAAAADLGYVVKLLAVAEEQDGAISAHVNAAMVPATHPLAAVRDVYNAVFVEADSAGELMFLGRGAGGDATASAVVGDLVEVARNLTRGTPGVGCTCYRVGARMQEPGEASVRYYVVLDVADEPGVLAAVASVFAEHGVSIASVRQEATADRATLAIVTHVAREAGHRATFDALQALPSVNEITSAMRVIGTAEA